MSTAATTIHKQQRVSLELHHEIAQFLYDEAELLDSRKFGEWLTLLADDLHYYSPIRYNRLSKDLDHEFGGADELALFDDTKLTMARRVKRLGTGRAWAEEPVSRTRRIVSNVRVAATDRENEFDVRSNFLLNRNHFERSEDTFVGSREDLFRRANNAFGWEVVSRRVVLNQATILARHISVFF